MKQKIITFLVFVVMAPVIAAAHPMGNFSINHHSTIRVQPNTISVRYILDFAEIPTYQMRTGDDRVRSMAEEWGRGLKLEVDGVRMPLELSNVQSQMTPGAAGLPTLRVTMDLSTPWDGQRASLHFLDTNFSDRIGWKEVLLPGATDRSDGLTNYASDLLSSAPNIIEARVDIPIEGTDDLSATSDSVATRENTDRLGTLLAAEQLPLRAVLFGVGLAFMLGALHALSPGHGKTLVAAYLVGNRGTPRHALFLGTIVTFTHTIGVFTLGVVTLFLSQYIVPERLYPWLSFLSGVTIVAIGVRLFRERFGKLVHDHGPTGHSHDVPKGLGFKTLLGMGFSGGIVPCPSALVVLLSAVALHRIAIGLLFILAFSLGLASVLVAVGVLVVRAGGWLSRLDSHGAAAKWLPVISALVVTFIGMGIAVRSVEGTEIISSAPSFGGEGFVVLGLGLLLGLKHAMDADHVVAVTTFVSEERSLLRSCWIGAFWGLGHTLSLTVAGLIVFVLKISISERLAAQLEFLVATMLVCLGARILFQIARGRVDIEHSHANWSQIGLRPLLVGMVHGAAGSAALMLLVLSTIRSPLEAFLYILIFGLGSIVGMLAISVLLAVPLHWAKSRVVTSYRPIQLMAGLFSCVFGLYLGAHIWISLP
jgi:ABC-type nickel/cobalt efflux system permease component RcnA